MESQPRNAWNVLQPSEYGFYANVNPEVDHPRWSQGRERRIGEFFRRKTLMFNGYADQVAGLYAGMDLEEVLLTPAACGLWLSATARVPVRCRPVEAPARQPAAMHMKVVKRLVFVLCLAPFAWLVFAAFTDRLGANPIDAITDETGTWTLRFLVATLAVTPLRRLTGWNEIITLRRMLGLFAFFYGSLHAATYVVLDQFFDPASILGDIAKRPFITAGFTGFVLMVPLAITSTAGWIRRLGGRRWQQLHRLAYVSAAAGVIHYYWLVKADVSRPLRYAVVLAVLLLARVVWGARQRRAVAETTTARAGRAG